MPTDGTGFTRVLRVFSRRYGADRRDVSGIPWAVTVPLPRYTQLGQISYSEAARPLEPAIARDEVEMTGDPVELLQQTIGHANTVSPSKKLNDMATSLHTPLKGTHAKADSRVSENVRRHR